MLEQLLSATLALSLFAAAPSAQPACPIQGVATASLGSGTPSYGPNQLVLGWDVATCSLTTQVVHSACCNVYLTQHYLGIAAAPRAVPLAVGGAFLPGSTLYIDPVHVLGPLPRETGVVQLPPDPALVGRSFTAQAVSFYFATIPIGGSSALATTQAVQATFL